MNPINYDEKVTVLGFANDTLVPLMRTVSTLAEAVKVIVEEWDHAQVRHIVVVREEGPIDGLDAVTQMYERPDLFVTAEGSFLTARAGFDAMR